MYRGWNGLNKAWEANAEQFNKQLQGCGGNLLHCQLLCVIDLLQLFELYLKFFTLQTWWRSEQTNKQVSQTTPCNQIYHLILRRHSSIYGELSWDTMEPKQWQRVALGKYKLCECYNFGCWCRTNQLVILPASHSQSERESEKGKDRTESVRMGLNDMCTGTRTQSC